jgi:hypothetical protein
VREHLIVVRYLRILLGQFLGASSRRNWAARDAAETGARRYLPSPARYDAEMAERLRAMGYLR